jgi:hypothetical protein
LDLLRELESIPLEYLKYKLSQAEFNASAAFRTFRGASTGTWVSLHGDPGEHVQGDSAGRVSFFRE